ncbi:MAG: Hsp20/alpha crystallin family protein [Halobacteriales archaeon]|nr:Hsp20/alpha crystallin family protein [Halobacteriales archaeon]
MPRRIRPADRLESIVERLDRALNERDVDAEIGGSGILSGVDVDILDDGEEIVVIADLPGFEKDDISVQSDEHSLRISAEHAEETEEEEKDYHKRERRQRSLSRTVTLPVEVEVGGAKASYDNGVLSVRLPKVEMAEGEEIDID